MLSLFKEARIKALPLVALSKVAIQFIKHLFPAFMALNISRARLYDDLHKC